MTPYEFKKSLTPEQKQYYEAQIQGCLNREEQYYRECIELKQINRALLTLLTQMEKKMKSDRRKIRESLRFAASGERNELPRHTPREYAGHQDDREGGMKDEGFTLQGIP